MIEEHLQNVFDELGLTLPGTAKRIAKMYQEEIFTGLVPDNAPKISLFTAPSLQEIQVKGIRFVSFCEHHLLPMFGKADISYIPNGSIMGLSTIHEVVHFFAKRPQLQERLTTQIGQFLQKHLKTDQITVEIEAEHSCVRARNILDSESIMVTRFRASEAAIHNLD